MGFDKDNSFVSGEPGTTGREPFEGSYTSSSGATGTTGTGHHGHHGHHHGEHGSSGLGGAVGGTDPAVGHQGHGHSGGYSGVGEHSSGQFGGIANVGGNDGYNSGNTGGLTGDKYGSGGGVGTGREFDQTGNTKADSETGATHHTGHHHSGHHGAGTGLAAAAAGATGAGATGVGHHSTGPDVGVQRQEGSSLAGSGYDNNDDSSKYGNDRVGALGQNSSAYERTGADGPQTHGAAGTDRFDTDRSKTGNAGSGAGFGPGGERHTEYGGNTAEGYGGENDVDKRRKAEGTGGVGGLLTTTDKEFTGRDKLGGASGAYGDETGPFKGNKDGPGNNTALTGREGNYDNNPVAKDASKEVHPTRPSDSTTSNTTGSHSTTDAHDGEKKGIVEKIKDAFHA